MISKVPRKLQADAKPTKRCMHACAPPPPSPFLTWLTRESSDTVSARLIAPVRACTRWDANYGKLPVIEGLDGLQQRALPRLQALMGGRKYSKSSNVA